MLQRQLKKEKETFFSVLLGNIFISLMASSANFFLLAAASPTLPSLLFLDKQARLDVYKIRVIHFKPQQKQVLFHVQTICLAIAADGCVIQQRAKSSGVT